jgi:hypothetical protein
MALEICPGPMDNPLWTQDRKSLMIFYKIKKYESGTRCHFLKSYLCPKRRASLKTLYGNLPFEKQMKFQEVATQDVQQLYCFTKNINVASPPTPSTHFLTPPQSEIVCSDLMSLDGLRRLLK